MTALYPGKEEKEKMKEEDCKKAYQLWLDYHTYKQIAKELKISPSAAIRAVKKGRAKYQDKCLHCQWRKDGAGVCILPVCLRSVGKLKRRKTKK